MSDISPIQENNVQNWNEPTTAPAEQPQTQEVFEQQPEPSYQPPDITDEKVQAQLKDLASYTSGVGNVNEGNHYSNYANYNSAAETYSQRREILEANRDILMPMLNAQNLADQAEASENVDKDVLSEALTSVLSHPAFADYKPEEFKEVAKSSTLLNAAIGDDLDDDTRVALQNALNKYADGKIQSYTDVKAADIPKEVVDNFFDSVDVKSLPGVVDVHNYTLQTGSYKEADGNISTGMIFAASGDNVKMENGKVSIDMTGAALAEDGSQMEKEDAKDAIQSRIAEAFGLKDTDGDGMASLNSEAGAVIADMIARMPENSEIFKGYDFANGTVDKFTNRVYSYMQKHPDAELAVKAVDISSVDANKTADDLIKEGNEVKFSKLHNTTDVLQIGGTDSNGDKVEKGIDILGSIEYGSTTLKEALQDSIVANSFRGDTLSALQDFMLKNEDGTPKTNEDGTPKTTFTYQEALEALQNKENKTEQEQAMYENLALIGGYRYWQNGVSQGQERDQNINEAESFVDAIKEAQLHIYNNTETPEALKELAAATVRQELGNNFDLSAFNEFFDQASDSSFALLNADLKGLAEKTGSNTTEVKLEDANFARRMQQLPKGYKKPQGGGGGGRTKGPDPTPGPTPPPGPDPEPECPDNPEFDPPDIDNPPEEPSIPEDPGEPEDCDPTPEYDWEDDNPPEDTNV